MNDMPKYYCILLMSLTLFQSVSAETIDNSFAKYKEYAKSVGNQSLNAMQSFHPEATFKDFDTNPVQSQFYQGVESEQSDLEKRAREALQNDESGKLVVENFDKHKFETNTLNSAIVASKQIEKDSQAIVNGKSAACDNAPPKCEIVTHIETCLMSKKLPDIECHKTRRIEVLRERKTQHIDIEVMVHKKWKGSIDINLMNGTSTNTIYTHINQPIQMTRACSQMNARSISIRNNASGAPWVYVRYALSCANNGVLPLWISKSFKRDYPLQISLDVDLESQPYESGDEWSDSCEGRDLSSCQIRDEQCVTPSVTKIINGISITRDCWEKRVRYSCVFARVNECESQKERGCLQIDSSCDTAKDNQCMLYKQSYSCAEKTCKLVAPCIKKVFCADGSCVDTSPSENDEFADSVSKLSATSESAQEYNKTQATLFAGHIVQCKIMSLDFIDCCSDKGWGKALSIAHCKEEDKALGQAKSNYLVHYLGDFCADKILGQCFEHKHTYCVFDSKMGRILQEGRLEQLNPQALGTAKEPNCSGMSVDELKSLDFKAIEFIKPVYPKGTKQPGEPTEAAGILVASPNQNIQAELIKRVEKTVGGQ